MIYSEISVCCFSQHVACVRKQANVFPRNQTDTSTEGMTVLGLPTLLRSFSKHLLLSALKLALSIGSEVPWAGYRMTILILL